MELKRYKDAGAIFAEAFNDASHSEWTYTGTTEYETTPYGYRIVFGTGVEIDTDLYHNHVFEDENFTFAAKIRMSTNQTISSAYIGLGNGDNDTFWTFRLRRSGGNTYVNFDIYYNDSPLTSWNSIYTIPNFDDTRFYAIVVTCIDGDLTMYVDGESVNTGTYSKNALAEQTIPTQIGTSGALNQNTFTITDLIMFDRGWSAEEAQEYAGCEMFDHMNIPIYTGYNVDGSPILELTTTAATNIANNLKSDKTTELGLTGIQLADFNRSWKHLIGTFIPPSWEIFDASTWTYDGSDGGTIATEIGASTSAPYALCLVESENKLFVGGTGGRMWTLNCTGYDFANATLDSSDVLSRTNTLSGIAFNDDGTKLYVEEYIYQDVSVAEYDLSTPYDISTSTFSYQLQSPYKRGDTSVYGVWNAAGFAFKPDGTKLYRFANTGSPDTTYLYTYDLGTAWDLSTASVDVADIVVLNDDYIRNAFVNPGGNIILFRNAAGSSSIRGYRIENGWYGDPTTITLDNDLYINFEDQEWSFTMSSDGSKILPYIVTDGELKIWSTDAVMV
jgi:hypothetical protein